MKYTEKMNREKIEETIEYWALVRDGLKTESQRIDSKLCLSFFNANCWACPVCEMTGHTRCKSTPYEEWEAHYGIDKKRIVQNEVEKRLAENMLKFINEVKSHQTF